MTKITMKSSLIGKATKLHNILTSTLSIRLSLATNQRAFPRINILPYTVKTQVIPFTPQHQQQTDKTSM